ncbi:MAG: phosphate acyltransferase PlsX [Deltaproteobacteria bacterium]|jgi:glycerol-3-phosphate acyltransferase PlsX|nr:phosphate acyltransferase PlsX [Deltaproteobacteria bacterium]
MENDFHFESEEVKPVAVDVCGGDKGLGVQVEGAVQAFKEFGVVSILVGPKLEINTKLESLSATNLPIQIVDAQEVISMDDSPARAVRKNPNSSLCVAYKLVKDGAASSIISSGNSGAMMIAGKLICGLIPGIERPAITTLIPVAGNNKPNVVLDVGANVECDATHLIQFAVMGAVYYKSLFGSPLPKVALLSNGTESSKGKEVTRSAAMALQNIQNINYIGFVEGRDVPKPTADVIVTDGFTGNVLLKAMEGTAGLIKSQLTYKAEQSWLNKLRFLAVRGILKEAFGKDFDYSTYGGAPLLGLQNVAVVLHGASDERAVKNAIRVADSFARKRLIESLTEELCSVWTNCII